MLAITIDQQDGRYPGKLKERLGNLAPRSLALLGSGQLLEQQLVGLVCSARCPGRIILQTYEMTKELARSQGAVVSGFQSPVERECLRIFLRESHPVILCLARSLHPLRLPKQWQLAIKKGTMLIVSPFTNQTRRITVQSARKRNLVVIGLADKVWIPYAAPGSNTMAIAEKSTSMNVPILTFKGGENAVLITLGETTVDKATMTR